MTTSDAKVPAYVLIAAASLLGGVSMLGFLVFVFTGSWNVVSLGLSESTALCVDAGLCLVFFVQHSVMVRGSFRTWSARFLPEVYFGAVYAITSGIVLLALLVLWQGSAYTLVAPTGMVRWLLRAVYFLCLAGVAWGASALRFFDPLGLEAIRGRLRGRKPLSERFVVRGPYRWVRHPLYLFLVLMIWSCPDLTLDRLVFNVLFTAWIVVGAVLEERDLVAAFGDAYREYQRTVPMLVPARLRPAD